MSTPFLFILMSLTTFRVTWFITEDSFPAMERIRRFFLKLQRNAKIRKNALTGEHEYYGWRSWTAELISCYWCVSVWVSGIITFAVGVGMPFLWWGGIAATSAITAAVVDRLRE